MKKRILRALGVLLLFALMLAEIERYEYIESNKKIVYQSQDDLWQTGRLEYKGELYQYNENVKTYLIMGIDKLDPVKRETNYYNGGQCDALFLLLLDEKNDKMTIVAINRNTITDIQTCNQGGMPTGTEETFLCLQHAYGDGAEISCERTVWAVSNLFYELPIDGYVSINMGAFPLANDVIGGVEVEVLEDIIDQGMQANLHQGEIVRLQGMEAFAYINIRDLHHPDGATKRLERQKQYLTNAIHQIMTSDENKVKMILEGYQVVQPYVVSDVNVVEMAYGIWQTGINLETIISIPGEDVPKDEYVYHYVDKDAMLDVLVDLYYEKEGE